MKRKGTKDLSYTQRIQLEAYLNAGLHKKQIAVNFYFLRRVFKNPQKFFEILKKFYKIT
jgi:hypothetical protein